jgi:cytochrome c554/c'-like protein
MRIISIVIASAIWIASLTAASVRAEPAAAGGAVRQSGPQFAFATACRECHTDIYNSWAKSKHANAIDRLSSAERQTECALCHTTGPDPKNAKAQNVQCEACHGGAAEHAASPFSGVNPVKKPQSDVCERCHNEKGPRFRGFVYAGMAKLVHALPK